MEQQAYPDYGNLTPEAKNFLDRGLDTFELSPRTCNCITNGKLNDINLTPFSAKYVREVVSKTDTELLRIINFGRKSLNELKEVLAYGGVRIGMNLPPEVVEHGSAAYEAKKTGTSAVTAEPEVAAEPTDEAASTLPLRLEDQQYIDAINTVILESKGSGNAKLLKAGVILLKRALEDKTRTMTFGQKNDLYKHLLEAAGRTAIEPVVIGPILHRLWEEIQNPR